IGRVDQAPRCTGTAQTVEVLLQWIHGWFRGSAGGGIPPAMEGKQVAFSISAACFGKRKIGEFLRQAPRFDPFSIPRLGLGLLVLLSVDRSMGFGVRG